MADEMGRAGEALRPATYDEVRDSLALAVRYRDGKRVRGPEADGFMARIAVERLVEHLAHSGFVVMKRLPSASPNASRHMPPRPPLKD